MPSIARRRLRMAEAAIALRPELLTTPIPTMALPTVLPSVASRIHT
jgi:hypothetical protein